MLQLADDTHGFMKRDLAPNINFFMNVPVSKDGGSKFDDGVSAPGKYVEMKALEHTMVLVSRSSIIHVMHTTRPQSRC